MRRRRLIVGVLTAVFAGLCALGALAAAETQFSPVAASGSSELHTARVEAVAAPLRNGTVLIAAGASPSTRRRGLRSAELFNPASDTFTALPASGSTELHSARFDAVAARLPNGEVLVAGGAELGIGVLRSAELFNDAKDRFTALPESGDTRLHTARLDAVAAPLPDGQVLIAGGYGQDNRILRSAELFNPLRRTFTALPASGNTELHTDRVGAVAAPLPGGEVLVAGGYDNQGNVVRSAELFNPASHTFTALPASGNTELHTGRASAVAAPLPNGDVLIAGGTSNSLNGLRTAELFDPTLDTFTRLVARTA